MAMTAGRTIPASVPATTPLRESSILTACSHDSSTDRCYRGGASCFRRFVVANANSTTEHNMISVIYRSVARVLRLLGEDAYSLASARSP